MKQWERELYVSRIVAGRFKIRIGDTLLFFGKPSRDQKAYAQEVYREALKDAELAGVMFQEEVDRLMLWNGLWSDHKQEQLDMLATKMDDMKVALYEAGDDASQRLAIRNALRKGIFEKERLEGAKHALDYLSCDGIALSAKYRYLMGCSLYYPDGSPFWRDDECWNEPDGLIDKSSEVLSRERLNDSQFRELALNDPWRSLWGARNHTGRGLFDIASVDLSDDQRAIITWSSIFDSIREHPNRPPESVFSDDDMLDGWMIIQRRKNEAERDKNTVDSRLNDRIRNSDEVFVVVDKKHGIDVEKIEKMNDAAATMIKRQREAYLKKEGVVKDIRMPDKWMDFQTQVAQMAAAKMKG